MQPLRILEGAVGNSVLIRLKYQNFEIRGTLRSYDTHLNVCLENAEQNLEESQSSKKLGDIILRGDNIIFISPS
ncbi:MAG: LSM domain-containing protein [Candidatus Hodarchaeota archaeon]